MEKKMNALDLNDELFFPLEIMFEILSRLTVVSLLRCKCVCKRWNDIIHHPKFIQMHMLRTTNQCVCYSTRKDESFIVIISRYGLLIEKSKIFGKYRVRNPATKQILALPDPKEMPIIMTIVFLASTNSYKLVYIYEHEDVNRNIGFKVLDFEGSDLSWRTINNHYFTKFVGKRQIICFDLHDRFLYCCALYHESCNFEIHCLDVETESLRNIPIIVPRSFFCDWKKVEVGKWDEKLVALMNIVGEDLHIWVLEDPVRVKWAEKKIIPLPFLKVNPGMKEKLTPYWASQEKIWFKKDDGSCINYEIRSKQAWESQYSMSRGNSVMCDGTLVTLKGMETEKKRNSDGVFEDISDMLFKLVK